MLDTKCNAHHRAELEKAIDASSLQDVLRAIANICEMKADHIRENWPATKNKRFMTTSEGLALCWERAGNNVYNAAHSGSVDAVSR